MDTIFIFFGPVIVLWIKILQDIQADWTLYYRDFWDCLLEIGTIQNFPSESPIG